MKMSIMQPAYLPWLGFFDRVEASDLLIILDNVLLDTNSKTRFTNRNKIRTKEGWIWLSLPMKTKGLFGKVLIKDIEIADNNWKAKHWKAIETNYSKANYFRKYASDLEEIYKQEWNKMQDLLDLLTNYFFNVLQINVPVIKASSIPVKGQKSELILELCKYQRAKLYYSGVFGRDYLELNKFEENNIEVLFHEYRYPIYDQVYKGFEPYMSILDILFNYGERSMEIIKQGRNFQK